MKWTAQKVALVAFGAVVVGAGVGAGVYLYGNRMVKGYRVAYTFKASKNYDDINVKAGEIVRLVGKITKITKGVAEVEWYDIYNYSAKNSAHFDKINTIRDDLWITKFLGESGVAPLNFMYDVPDTFDLAVLSKVGMY